MRVAERKLIQLAIVCICTGFMSSAYIHLVWTLNHTWEEDIKRVIFEHSRSRESMSDVLTSAGWNNMEASEELLAGKHLHQENVKEVPKVYTVNPADYTMYVSCDRLNVREEPDVFSDIVIMLAKNVPVHVIGEVQDNDFVQIEFRDAYKYVSKAFLSAEKVKEYSFKDYIATPSQKLTPSGGTIKDSYGFRLTWYNLPMDRCVKGMRNRGYSEAEYEVWVDQYGYKRFGPYIMAAGAYKKGTILTCSQGDVIIVDHGEFEETYGKMALDLATTW